MYSPSARIFKTAWFHKAAKKAKVADTELCNAVRDLMAGHGDDLGGGVFKKRLHNNQYRSIILAKTGRFWVLEYLFAKNDRDNIQTDELQAFRLLAKSYVGITDIQLKQLLSQNDLLEICHANENTIQK